MNRSSLEPDPQRWLVEGAGLISIVAGAWLLSRLPPWSPSLADFYRLASDAGWFLIGLGSIVLVGGAMAGRPLPPHGRPHAAGWAVGSCALVAALVFLDRVQATKMAVLDGVGTFWLDDDMMISMRYARHLAAGWGPVWNPGEPPVEGYSNPLWMALMAVPHALGISPAKASGVVLAINLGGLWAMLATGWLVARRLGLPGAAAWVALLAIALNRWVLYWAVGGAETVLLSVLVLIVAARLLGARRGRPLGWGDGVLIGLTALVRADALLPAVWMLAIWAGRARRGAARPWAWVAGPALVVLHLLWRRSYYGAWLPNTYELRMADVPTRPMFGAYYALYFLMWFGGMALLGLMAVWCGRTPVVRALAALPLFMMLYCIYAGGDELPEFRFMAPFVPLMILTGGAAAMDWLRRRPASGRIRSPSLRFAGWMGVMALAHVHALALPGVLQELGTARGQMERDNVRIGLMLKAHTRPEALIAHSWAGAAPYFSERPALDMLGKNDRHIASLPANPADYQPGHNKYDPAYVFARAPDVIVAGIRGALIQDTEAMAHDPARRAYPGLFVVPEHPAFVEAYRDGMVPLPISRDYHGIFVRRGSERADPPQTWRAIEALPWRLIDLP